MTKRLLIVGAGDLGREVFCWATQILETQRPWSIGGFLDNRPGILDGYNFPAQIVGSPETYEFTEQDRVVVAIGDPAQRQKYVELVAMRGAQFTSIVHPTIAVGLNNVWGIGCIFCPGVIITTNVAIGDHVIFNCRSQAGHDVQIGNYCTLSGFVELTGHVVLGESVFLGSHACVLPGVRIGDYGVIGAGSAVARDVNSNSTAMGVPAREMLRREPVAGS